MAHLPKADPQLAARALKTLQIVCRGNGVKAESITLESFDAAIHSVTASTFLELKPRLSDKTQPGKQVVGQVIASKNDIGPVVDKTILGALRDSSLRRKILDLVMKRPDQGFGLSGVSLNVDFLSQDFTIHEACRICHGQGRSPCPRCQGAGRETCNQCAGKTMVPCVMCRGTGQIPGHDGKTQPCIKCHGQRQMMCPLCQRTGKIPCRQCNTAGFAACTACSGTGWHTHVVHMAIQVIPHFDMDRGALPPAVAPMIDKNIQGLVQKGYIQISAKPAETKEDILAVAYNVHFPYGEIGFSIRKKPVKAQLFGYKSRLLELPDVLEKLTARGVQELEQAARGEGNVAGKIKKASRYRLLAFSLLAASQGTAKKTADMIMKEFPVGLSHKGANALARLSDESIARVTRKPRYMGLLLGLVVVASFYAFYYLGRGRAMIEPYLNNPNLDMVVDLFLILIGGTITTMCIRLSAASAMRHALGHLVPRNDWRRLIPKARTSGLWGYAGGLVLYLVMIELTVHLGKVTPEWYANLRALLLSSV